jgi:hypothetical protein
MEAARRCADAAFDASVVLQAIQQQFHPVRRSPATSFIFIPAPVPIQLISTHFKAFQSISKQNFWSISHLTYAFVPFVAESHLGCFRNLRLSTCTKHPTQPVERQNILVFPGLKRYALGL